MLVPIASLRKGLHVRLVDFYGDGTMMASLADSAGQRTHVCFDGRASSPIRHRLFQQARHPRQQGAVLLELARVGHGGGGGRYAAREGNEP